MPDSQIFNLAEVDAAIAATAFAGHIHHLATTTSTNDLALKAAQAGARIGVWIADQQTRRPRPRSPHLALPRRRSAFTCTALAAPPIPMQSALALSLRVAIAVQSAIAQRLRFSPPRPDRHPLAQRPHLASSGPAKKCGGILIDTALQPRHRLAPRPLRYAVIGIGINVNQTAFPPELDAIATSLRRESSREASRTARSALTRSVEDSTKCTRSVEDSTKCRREPLAAAILLALDAELRALATGDTQPANLHCANPTALQHLDLRQARPRRSSRWRPRLYWHHRGTQPQRFPAA